MLFELKTKNIGKKLSRLALKSLLSATLVLAVSGAWGQVTAWDFQGNAGNEVTVNATSSNSNITTPAISRGAGLTATALANSYSSNNFTASGDKNDAISNNKFLQFSIIVPSGYSISLSTLDARFRRSSTGPNTFQWQYSLDGFATAGVNMGSEISFTSTTTSGVDQAQINLSIISGLLNVDFGTTITIRLYGWGASQATGTFALGRNSSGDDLSIGGSVNINSNPTISLSSPSQVTAGNVNQGAVNHIISAFQAAVTDDDATVNEVEFTSAGTYSAAGDLSNYRLWYHTADNFGAATNLSTVASGVTTGSTVTFNSLNQSILENTTGYFWITADVSGTANTGNNFQATTHNLTFSSGNTSGSISDAGAQNIIASVSPLIVIDQTGFNSAFGVILPGNNSASSTYSVSASNLTTDLTITPPAGYEMRTGSNAFATTAIILSPSSGNIASTTVDVRFSPSAQGAFSGDLTHTSTGATTQSITLSGNSPVSYVWNQTDTASASVAANWTPSRNNPHSSDRLIFNTGNTVVITNIGAQSLRSIEITTNTDVTLTAATTVAINISDSLVIAAGANLSCSTSNAISINMNNGSKALVSGGITFTNGAHRLAGTETDIIEFLSGSQMTSGTGFSGNAFGNSTSSTGSVHFRNGSTYTFIAGSNPFAITNAITVFEPNSNYIHNATGSPSLSGRTYGNIDFINALTNLSATGGSPLTLNNLKISAGTINLNLTGVINISGNIEVDGTLGFSPASANAINFNGTNQIISGNGTFTSNAFANFVVNANSQISVEMDVNLTGTLTVNTDGGLVVKPNNTLTVGNLTNNGTLTLEATDESNYAQLITNGSVTGNVTVERTITGSTQGWRFISPAVSGTLANLGSSVQLSGAANVIRLNTNNPNAWVTQAGASTDAFVAGKGYVVYYGTDGVNGSNVATTLSLTGALNNSNVTVNGLSDGNGTSDFGWSVVGNPFAAGIDFNDSTEVALTNMDPSYYIWRPEVGNYATWHRNSGSLPVGILNGTIAPMQGFLVKANAASPVLTINRAARTSSSTGAQFRTTSLTDRMYIKVRHTSDNRSDEALLAAAPLATANFESDFDALKAGTMSTTAYSISTRSADNYQLAINVVPDFAANITIPVRITGNQPGPLSIEANLDGVNSTNPIMLEDLYLNRSHDLRTGAYQYAHIPAQTDRFVIHFQPIATSVVARSIDQLQVYAHEGRLYVKGLETATRLRVLDISGRLIYETSQPQFDANGIQMNLTKGTYLVQVVNNNGVKTSKVIF